MPNLPIAPEKILANEGWCVVAVRGCSLNCVQLSAEASKTPDITRVEIHVLWGD